MADLRPIDPKARVEILDVLRGFALLGILFNNILYFSGYAYQPFDALQKNPTFQFDEGLYQFLDVVVTAKFYTLFSILFAVGFYLQLSRHADETSGFLRVYRRRLFILMLIGFLHSLFWYGDILLLYALIGLVLVFFRNITKRNLFRLALVLIFLPTVFDFAILPFGFSISSPQVALAHVTYTDMTPETIINIFKNGSISEVFSLNLHHLIWRWLSFVPSGRILTVFGIFVLGYYLASIDFFRERVRSVKLLALGLIIGLSTSILAVMMGGNPYQFPSTPLNTLYKLLLVVGQISLCMFYMASIARLFQTASGRRILGTLKPVGRMALTNYIFQSLICVALFYGLGLNLAGEFGLVYIDCIAIGVLLVGVVLSNLWLKYFTFGPMEWVWRSLTYRQKISIR